MTTEQGTGSVVASFESPAAAKSAMAALERSGVPPRSIHIISEAPDLSRMGNARADEAAARWATDRIAVGALLGAAVGALIGALILALAVDDPGTYAWIGTLAGSAFAGAVIGAFISFGMASPRTPAAWRTYELRHAQEVCIAVRATRGHPTEEVSAALATQGGRDVQVTGL